MNWFRESTAFAPFEKSMCASFPYLAMNYIQDHVHECLHKCAQQTAQEAQKITIHADRYPAWVLCYLNSFEFQLLHNWSETSTQHPMPESAGEFLYTFVKRQERLAPTKSSENKWTRRALNFATQLRSRKKHKTGKKRKRSLWQFSKLGDVWWHELHYWSSRRTSERRVKNEGAKTF